MEAFEYLDFEVEDIEETQGTQAHSDLIVKAPLATNPYFAVLECTAVREGSEVEYQKLYQLGSNFPRYVTKYSKQYPSASYKMLVGRPSFSANCKDLAKEITLMTADTLIELLQFHEQCYFSQDELEKIFQQKGEIAIEKVEGLAYPYWRKGITYAWIYLSLIKDPKYKSLERKREWTNVERVIGMVKQWGSLFHNIELSEAIIGDAISDLSSPVSRVLLVDGQNVMLSSLPLEKVVQNLGELGEIFESYLAEYLDRARKVKESSK